MICGGYNGRRIGDCYTFGPNKVWNKVQSLKTPRSDMSTGNIVINGKLWISGGYDGSNLASTELVTEQAVMQSSNLPFTGYGHCSVFLDRTRIMTIGGSSGRHRDETHIMDTTTNHWTPGPELNKARRFHGCAKVSIGDKEFVVVSGGSNALNSVEYLDIANMDQGWQNGIDLSIQLSDHRMVTSEDTKDLFIVGGYDPSSDQNIDKIFKLSCEGSTPGTCSFKEIPARLKVARYVHIALPISDEFAKQLCL